MKSLKSRTYKKDLVCGGNIQSKRRIVQLNKYYIDMDSLDNNIIKVKYVKNRNILPNLPITYNISDDVKNTIIDVTNNKFNKEMYNKMNMTDKELIKAFLNACHISVQGLKLNDKDFEEQLNILYGQYNAGNLSVKPELIKNIKKAMLLNKISTKQSILLLEKLNGI